VPNNRHSDPSKSPSSPSNLHSPPNNRHSPPSNPRSGSNNTPSPHHNPHQTSILRLSPAHFALFAYFVVNPHLPRPFHVACGAHRRVIRSSSPFIAHFVYFAGRMSFEGLRPTVIFFVCFAYFVVPLSSSPVS
jgi:hypothetical protein